MPAPTLTKPRAKQQLHTIAPALAHIQRRCQQVASESARHVEQLRALADDLDREAIAAAQRDEDDEQMRDQASTLRGIAENIAAAWGSPD